MTSVEIVLAILGGVVGAALLCWVAITTALRLTRRDPLRARKRRE